MAVRKCRSCKTPKFSGDICTNPDCEKAVSPKYRLTGMQFPHTMAYAHGYHEAAAMTDRSYEPITTDAVLIPSEALMQPEYADLTSVLIPAPQPENEAAEPEPYMLWNGQLMPSEIVMERQQAEQSTRLYWESAHNSSNDWHQRFPGYCPMCSGFAVLGERVK